MSNLVYAGIGSRETPPEILNMMNFIGKKLAKHWVLRSGHADGADLAFETGAFIGKGLMEIYIPWAGFNGAPKRDRRFIVPDFTIEAVSMASKFHPAWDCCSIGARKLHTRNLYQVLGEFLDRRATMVVCWTQHGLGTGGTGQAIRIAKANNIPVFDLAIPKKDLELARFVEDMEGSLELHKTKSRASL